MALSGTTQEHGAAGIRDIYIQEVIITTSTATSRKDEIPAAPSEVIQDLDEEPETLIYDFGGGVRAQRVGIGTVALSDGMSLLDHTLWQLYSGRKQIREAMVDYDYQLQVDIFDVFVDDITAVLGADRAAWVRRTLSQDPHDTAPWAGRTKCVRQLARYDHTFDDEGNANRFEAECEGWLIYDHPTSTWYAWDLNRWVPADERVIQAARFVGRSVAGEESEWERRSIDDKLPRGYHEHVTRSAMLHAQKAMVTMAAANMSIDIQSASDPTLLACRNGIIDTSTGVFVDLWDCEAYKARYPIAYIDAEYTPGAKSEAWIQHLLTVMEDNTTEGLSDTERDERKYNLTRYLLRLLGYALYAGNPERVFVFFWGKGRNGKSTTTSVLSSIMGQQSACPALSQLYAADSDRPAPSVAAALPKRLAIFSEADGDAPISSGAFKELTGEVATERFRMMRANNVRTPIRCLPIGTTNDLPTFDKSIDKAVLDRLITIPFRHVFDGEDRDILGDLLRERDAIWSMMVDALREYLAGGLLPVHDCAKATQRELLVGEDLYRYLTTELEPVNSDRAEHRLSRQDLKNHYMSWALINGVEIDTKMVRDYGETYVRILTKRELNRLMSAIRIMGYKEIVVHGTRYINARKIAYVQRPLPVYNP